MAPYRMMASWEAGVSEGLQFVFNVASIAMNTLFIYMLRTEYFHVNMRIILALNAVSLIIAQFAALISDNVIDHLPVDLDAVKTVVDVIRDASLNVNTFMVVPLVGERLAASIRSGKYEHNGRPLYMVFAVFFILASWILNVLAACYTEDILMNFDLSEEVVRLRPRSERNKYWLIIYYASGGAIFLILYKFNQYRYEHGINLSRHTLSLRYQLAENVRTSRQLMPVALLTSATQTFYGYVLTGAVWSRFSSSFMELMFLVIPPMCAITAFLTPLLHIYFHDGMRRSLLSEYLRVPKPHVAGHVESLSGRNLMLEKEVTPTMYFEMLRESWLRNV